MITRLICSLLSLTLVAPVAAQLDIRGSTSALPLMQDMARAYMQAHPEAGIRVSGGGSAAGLQALIAGETEIAMSSRFIERQEMQLATRQSVYPVPFELAHDAIVPVVHPRNPLRNLSRRQIGLIYAGQIRNWAELGVDGGEISVICRDANSGTRALWTRMALRGRPAAACSRTLASNLEVIQAVRDDPSAIGYIGMAHLSASARVRPLRVDEQACTPECVRTGCYPLTRSLFLFSNGWPDREVLRFIRFTQRSAQARRIIREAGLTPVH